MSGKNLSKGLTIILLAALFFILLLILFYPDPQPGQEISDEPVELDNFILNYSKPPAFAYTYQQPDGNRLVNGKGTLSNASYAEVELPGKPSWLVASRIANASIWVAVSEEGYVSAFRLRDGVLQMSNVTPSRIPAGSPPLLMVDDDEAFVISSAGSGESLKTHPVILPESGRIVFIDSEGDLVFRENERVIANLDTDALPDARLLTDENERVLLLTNPGTEYGHAVLGDDIEASGITLVKGTEDPAIIDVVDLPEGDVVEGIAPIWADINGDDKREIIVTLSNREEGSRIAVFNKNGSFLASGPAVGQGYRWRHPVAVTSFGPLGEMEVVSVLTPHIGGDVEFYNLDDNRLEVAASITGYTSHRIGSRNLDMAVAGDFDGDGSPELLLPSQNFSYLGAIRHTENGAEPVWHLPLEGKLSTNLAAVDMEGGSIAVGAGTEDGKLRVWY